MARLLVVLTKGAPPPAAGASVAALGRFEVTRGGRPLAGRPGKAAAALKLVVAAGGRVPADVVVEALWPDDDPGAGRARLRNVLNRLRDAWGEIVVRRAEMLVLADGIDVDVFEFEAAAQRALHENDRGASLALARAAAARYRGELLPDDVYEAWTVVPRERLRRTYLALVDLVASEAATLGDVDDALRHYELGIQADPLDDHRYVAAARLLLDHGRRGAANGYIERADRVLDELGLNRSPAQVALVREIGL
jgi:DNA-binding SARP family transcriptional activator